MHSSILISVLVAFSLLSYSLADSGNVCDQLGDGFVVGVYVSDSTTISRFRAEINPVSLNEATDGDLESTPSTIASFTFNPPSFTVTGGGRQTLPPCPPRALGNTLLALGCIETMPSTMASLTFNTPTFGITDGGRPTLPACPPRVPGNTLSPLSCTEIANSLTKSTMPSFTFNPPTFSITDGGRPTLPNCPLRVSGVTLSPLGCMEPSLNHPIPPSNVIATTPQSCASPQSMTVSNLASTKASTPSISEASFFGPLVHLPRQEISVMSFQPSSTDSALHREPEPTTTSSLTIAPMSSPTATGSPAATTSSKTSGANTSKRPSMSFLCVCVLLAVFFVSPSSATSQPSRCADDSSLLCLGSVTVGSFAAPPTAPPSTPAVTSASSPTSRSPVVHTTEKGTITMNAGSPGRCSNNPSYLCIGSVTEGTFAQPPTAVTSSPNVSLTDSGSSYYSIVSTDPILTSSETAPASTSSVDSSILVDTTSQSSQSPLTSTVQATTTLPQSTTVATTVLTQSQSQHPTASLQSAGAMSVRSPRIFSFLSMLFRLFSSTAATSTSASQQATTTHCSEDLTSGYIGTLLSQTSTLSPVTPYPNLTSTPSWSIGYPSGPETAVWLYPCSINTTMPCRSTIPVVVHSHTRMPLSPTPSVSTSVPIVAPTTCANDTSKVCLGTATVTPSPCAVDQNKLCIGTIVLPTPRANNTSQMCLGNATASPTAFYQNSSMVVTRSGSSTTSNVSPTIARSTSTILSTTTLPPSTSLPPVQTSPAVVKTSGSLSRKPARVFFLLWRLFSLWPSFARAATPTPPTAPTPCAADPSGCIGTTPVSLIWTSSLIASLPTLTATPCASDPTYGCVGNIPATALAPPLASPTTCADQTSRACLGSIVLSYTEFISPTYWSSTTTPSTSSPISASITTSTSISTPISVSTSTSTKTSTTSEIVTTVAPGSSTPTASTGPSSTPPAKSGVGKKLASPLILLYVCLFRCFFANRLARAGSPILPPQSPKKRQEPDTKEGVKVATDDATGGLLELKPEPAVEAPQSEGIVKDSDAVEKSPADAEKLVESINKELPNELTKGKDLLV